MAGARLRHLVLLCLALVAATDVIVYEEDLNREHVPGVEAHSYTVVGDGQDGPSNFVMQVETLSMNLSVGATDAVDDESQGMGFGDQSSTLDTGVGSSDAFDWVSQQLDNFQILPFWVITSPQGPSPDCSQGQMLQNVACARFEPALSAVRSQDSQNVPSDALDNGWDIEVTFVPYDAEADNEGLDQIDSDFMTSWLQSGGELSDGEWVDVGVEDGMSTDGAEHWLSGCLFFMLLFACILTFFVCLKQGCELRRAMKENALKAEEFAFDEGVEEEKPLLQKEGFGDNADLYMDITIKPIAEPALKAVYP